MLRGNPLPRLPHVDDIRGFQSVFVNGMQQAVSAGAPLSVTVGSNLYELVAVTPDGTNASTAPGGVSGQLTFSANVTVADGTAGNAVQAATASAIVRPASRLTTAALQAGYADHG